MTGTGAGGIRFIADETELAAFCAAIADSPMLAIDTEFERSRTYFAELCLVQVAAGSELACIDPLAIADMRPLYTTLAAHRGSKILHAARQDLEVLYQAAGVLPAPLLDTQLAAALCGHAEQIGYGDLVREVLGITLAKTATRTDWRQRPLSAEQLDYAADDVRYLEPLATALCERLRDLGRLTWLEEDCALLLKPELYDPPAEQAWQRIKGIGSFAGAARSRAVALATWREGEARARNLPRNWVIKDSDLLDIAARGAQSVRDLIPSDSLNAGAIRRFGAAMIEIMGAAGHAIDLPSERRLNGDGRVALKALLAELQARAAELGLSPAVLATRAEAEAVIGGRLAARQLGGWRREVLADMFAPWLERGGEGWCE